MKNNEENDFIRGIVNIIILVLAIMLFVESCNLQKQVNNHNTPRYEEVK